MHSVRKLCLGDSAIQLPYLFLGKPVCVILFLLKYDSTYVLLPVACLGIPKLDLLHGDLYVTWWVHLLLNILPMAISMFHGF